MDIIQWPTGAGKTSELLAYMLCPENADVHYIAPTMKMAVEAGREFEKFGGDATGRFHGATYLHKRGLPSAARYVIDELEGVLGGLVWGKIEIVTSTLLTPGRTQDPTHGGVRGRTLLTMTARSLEEENN